MRFHLDWESKRNMFHLEPSPEIQFHKNQEREGDDITVLLNSLPTKMFVGLFVFSCNLQVSVTTLDTTSRGLLALDVVSSRGLLCVWQHGDQLRKRRLGTFIVKLSLGSTSVTSPQLTWPRVGCGLSLLQSVCVSLPHSWSIIPAFDHSTFLWRHHAITYKLQTGVNMTMLRSGVILIVTWARCCALDGYKSHLKSSLKHNDVMRRHRQFTNRHDNICFKTSTFYFVTVAEVTRKLPDDVAGLDQSSLETSGPTCSGALHISLAST